MLYPSIPSYRASVAAAWTAVGLTEEMENAVELSDGVPLPGQAASVSNKVKHYYISGVMYGETVTCSLAGFDGNPDLYVSTNGFAHPSTHIPVNSCTSVTPGANEQCYNGHIIGVCCRSCEYAIFRHVRHVHRQ
jgi:hypothetical protein